MSSDTCELDFNFIDLKREFFTTYLPYILIKATKMAASNRGGGGVNRTASLESYISRADYAFISAKPRVANCKFTAPTTENDYVDDEDSTDLPLISNTEVAISAPNTSNDSSTAAVATTVSCNSDMVKLKKGIYMYEDLSCLNIIVPNERF